MITTSLTLTLVFGVSAAGFAASFVFALPSALAMQRASFITSGTVTEMQDVPTEGWIAHIRYCVDEQDYVITIGSNGGYVVGETVALRYLPDDPGTASVNTRGHIWLAPIGGLVAALVFAGTAALMYGLGRLHVL